MMESFARVCIRDPRDIVGIVCLLHHVDASRITPHLEKSERSSCFNEAAASADSARIQSPTIPLYLNEALTKPIRAVFGS